MFIQLALGSGLLLVSVLLAGISFWCLEVMLDRSRGWLGRPPHRPKMALVLGGTALLILVQMTVAVWLWALAFLALGVFQTLEPAIYFALVAFTTLGFGDILLPEEWRLLGGLAAANGLLNIGFVTALMVEGLRDLRQHQISRLDGVQ